MAPRAKAKDPTRVIVLISWMAVYVLALPHVDASDFVPLLLAFPGTAPEESARTSLHVQLLALVKADTVGVCFDVVKLIALGRDAGSLDGSILQLLAVW